MWQSLSLRMRIYSLLVSIVFLALIAGSAMVWYTYRIGEQLANVIDGDIRAYERAEALESALVNQKGFVSYYLLDGDPNWLRQLGEYRQIFRERLNAALDCACCSEQLQLLDSLAGDYASYTRIKDEVVGRYRAGQREAAVLLFDQAQEVFLRILQECRSYRNFHRKQIDAAREKTRRQTAELRWIAASVMALALILGAVLSLTLGFQVLAPLRKLAADADRRGAVPNNGNIVNALRHGVEGLISDVQQATSKLERSQEHLLQVEKLAMVGKLAAGMAHSIRNPFTSVKMRLFSLSRTLDMTDAQREDFEVICEEIRHIDTILQNFLEFSRPPRYQFQTLSPSAVVDAAVQLLEHRLKSNDVDACIDRAETLPPVRADAEQLKEVFVNLMANACEAMENGGSIVIEERTERADGKKPAVVIRVCDNGPGIPETLLAKIREPFFSTKEAGTGLGLSIAQRIIDEHGGCLKITAQEGHGSQFSIVLPIENG